MVRQVLVYLLGLERVERNGKQNPRANSVQKPVPVLEWILEKPVCNLSEKFLLKRQECTSRMHKRGLSSDRTSISQFCIPLRWGGGRSHLVIMKNRPLCLPESDGFIKICLSVLTSLTTQSIQYRRFFFDNLALCLLI
jgi:hypothetical protein